MTITGPQTSPAHRTNKFMAVIASKEEVEYACWNRWPVKSLNDFNVLRVNRKRIKFYALHRKIWKIRILASWKLSQM